MRYTEFIIESPALELAKRLPSLRKHNYDTIDQLTRTVAKKHRITNKALNDLFVRAYSKTPDQWLKNKLDESYTINDFKVNFFESMNHYKKWAHSPKLSNLSNRGMTRKWVDNYNTIFIDSINESKNQFAKSKSEAEAFSKKFKQYDQRDDVNIKVGEQIAILSATVVPGINNSNHPSRIELAGFTKPKKIVKIHLDNNDKIDTIEFADGSRFPEAAEFTNIDGTNITNTIFFNNGADATKAYTGIWMLISTLEGEGWKLEEYLSEDIKTDSSNLDIQQEVDKFAQWAGKKLNIKSMPTIELSMDTEEAQTNHHTGGHVEGSGSIWVYANNRNLVDMLRTVFHELVHVRQGELNMIKPGDSYPGSPIEAMADMLAGKYIKIYGAKHNHIFQ
jgi:hypothetical protein